MIKLDPAATRIPMVFSSDGYLLHGNLHLPAKPRPPVVIGLHGLFSSGDSPKQTALAQHCTQQGIAYFRFDHRGCGQSEGKFDRVTSLDGRCRDLMNAMDMLAQSRLLNSRKIGLFGSSMGGTVCLNVAAERKIGPLVTVAAPIQSEPVLQALEQARDPQVQEHDQLAQTLRFDLTQRLKAITRILVFHGSADEVVPPSHGQKIFDQAGEPKKIIIQTDGDHRMSSPRHQADFIRLTTQWFQNGLDAA